MKQGLAADLEDKDGHRGEEYQEMRLRLDTYSKTPEAEALMSPSLQELRKELRARDEAVKEQEAALNFTKAG